MKPAQSGRRPTPGPKAFDIFRPGKTHPQATSRPVIVSNKPEQADPMVKEEKTPELPLTPEPASTLELPATQETGEQPPDRPYNATPPAETTESDSPKSQESEEWETPEPVNEDSIANATESEPLPLELTQPPEETPVDDKYGFLSQSSSAATEAPFISIHHKSKRRRLLWWTIGVVWFLVFVAFVLDVVLDAGWWTPDFNVPHTHIIQKIKVNRS